MEYLNEAQQLADEFNSLFPVLVNHSGGTHSCETFAELEEWDCAAGEMWSNFLDIKGFGSDFSLEELERRGDDLMLEMYVRQNIESYVNGNITSAIDDLNTMIDECDFDDVIDFVREEIKGTSTTLEKILFKLLNARL